MISFNITSNVKKHVNKLSRIQKKAIPEYLIKTINDLAIHVQEDERQGLVKRTDRPQPQTLKDIIISKAIKRKKPYNALIAMKNRKFIDDGVGYVYTGGTEPARYEYYPSPRGGEGDIIKDKYGNIRRNKGGTIRTTKKRFIGKAGRRQKLALWERTGGKKNPSLKMLGTFTRVIRHRKLLDYADIGRRAVRRNVRKVSKRNFKLIKNKLTAKNY